MEHKLKSVLSGTGFYLLLAVCLIGERLVPAL